MRRSRRSRALLCLGVMALGAASPGAVARATPASAQQSGTILGTVTCALTRQPLEGVSIKVGAHDSVAARTGPDGRFFLDRVPPGRTTLVLELRPGYVPALRLLDVLPGSATEILVELAPVTAQADELVVAVEGSDPSATVRIYPMGGARALGGGGSASDLLARGFPGVDVRRGSGGVGAGAGILIRGVGSLVLPGAPLVFLDGIQVGGTAGWYSAYGDALRVLDQIPAESVGRIEVLRGSSAARYGLGSGNGVILVFTRKGP
ncbi:MAG TPA: TonB-dependent receptor plug domain-containing protein [Longimicrobiales bacterium]|nr:TonB-dependent receptor plug domain-containing protein [Longimicrobiales bacterium]